MAIKEIFSDGAHLPEPKKGEEMEKEKEKDAISQMEDAVIRGHRLRAFSDALGGNALPAPPPKSEEKYILNIGDVLNAQAQITNKTLETLVNMRNQSPDATSSPYFVHLLEELKELKQKYDTPPPDPMELLTHGAERLERLAEFMKKNMGLTSPVTSDTSHLIELERIRLESQERGRHWETETSERRHQWEIEMEERRRQWGLEDQRRKEELELKKFEILDSRASRAKAGEMFGDILGSLSEGIEAGAGNVAGKPDHRETSSSVSQAPLSFVCHEENCRATVNVPPGAREATCEKCGVVYDMVEG